MTPVAAALSALFLPLLVRALAGGAGAPAGSPPASRGLAVRLRFRLAAIGLKAPVGGGGDLVLGLWAASLMGATTLLLMVAARTIAPGTTTVALDRFLEWRFGDSPGYGAVLRALIAPTALAAAAAEVIIVRGYIQGLAMRRFGAAGACAPWIAAALGRGTTGYLLGLDVTTCVVLGLGGLLPGPILEALYSRSASVLPLFLARVTADLVVASLALLRAPLPAAGARAAVLAVAAACAALLLPLAWPVRGGLRRLWRDTVAIARHGLAAGLPLGAGLVAAQTLALVVAGPALACLLAGLGLVIARLGLEFSRAGTS